VQKAAKYLANMAAEMDGDVLFQKNSENLEDPEEKMTLVYMQHW
jgi:hypothetical protein